MKRTTSTMSGFKMTTTEFFFFLFFCFCFVYRLKLLSWTRLNFSSLFYSWTSPFKEMEYSATFLLYIFGLHDFLLLTNVLKTILYDFPRYRTWSMRVLSSLIEKRNCYVLSNFLSFYSSQPPKKASIAF